MDALIIGAGPTGLLMASELARYGLSCRIIDTLSSPTDKSKALVIQPRTLEIFHILGIETPFLQEGIKLKKGNPFSNAQPLAHLDFSQLDSPFPFILGLEQSKTEKFLGQHLDSMGLHVERQVELIEVVQNEKKVKATLLHHASGKREEVEADWLIGCDGAHSFVRKSLQFSFKGKAFSDIFSLADIHIQWKYPHEELFFFLESKGVVAAFPLPEKNRYRLVFQLKRCRALLSKQNIPLKSLVSSDLIADPTLEETQATVRRCADPQAIVSDPIWMANFHINSRLTSSYRKGRIFLAGDAAHIHSPVGGQGMNTGLQDAFNLAWKLAFTHQQKARPHLLDSYNQERHFIAQQLLKATEAASTITTLHNPVAVSLRNHIVRFLMQIPSFQKRIVRAISQTAICYPKSALVQESGHFQGGPRAGCRAPNAILLKEGKEVTLFSLWKKPTQYYVLLFSPSPEFLRDYNHCTTLVISKEPSKESFLDPEGKVHALYGIVKDGAYIIRPDTYIGYRQTPCSIVKIHSFLKDSISF